MTPTPTTAATESATRSRRVYSPQEMAELLALFEQGGTTSADFCREMSVNEATFSLWRRQAREGAMSTEGVSQFAEVQVSAPKATEAASSVTLHLPGGARIEVGPATDAVWQGLGLLLKTLHS